MKLGWNQDVLIKWCVKALNLQYNDRTFLTHKILDLENKLRNVKQFVNQVCLEQEYEVARTYTQLGN
jgi:hypothetical protein